MRTAVDTRLRATVVSGSMISCRTSFASAVDRARGPLWARNRPLSYHSPLAESDVVGGMARKSLWTPPFKFVGPGTRDS